VADYYETLGVSRDASTEEIKRAFRRLARETHPDANPDDPAAEARFRQIAEAYEVLSDPRRRAAYDRGDRVDLSDLFSSFAGVEDLLSRFFGGGFGAAQAGPGRGHDVAVAVTVSLAEVAQGVAKDLTFETGVTCSTCSGSGAAPGTDLEVCGRCGGQGAVRVSRQTLLGAATTIVTCERCRGRGRLIAEPCETCSGTGSVQSEVSMQVEVPAGIEDGARLRLAGKGAAGPPGGRPGDLFVEIRVTPDSRFARHGADLVHQARIGLAEAALGTDISVPTVDGDDIEIGVPAGTQPGTVFKLSKKGLPRLQRRGRGDLLVEVVVEVPESTTPEQEQALRAYAEATGEKPAKAKKGRR
jgi:molecular chaperone DnaJ